jgi:hypothetical protein
MTEILLLSQFCKENFDGIPFDTPECAKLAAVDDPIDSRQRQLYVLRSGSFIEKTLAVVFQVILNIGLSFASEYLLLRIDQSRFPQSRFVLRLGRRLRGEGFIRETLTHPLLTIMVNVLVVPRGVLLAFVTTKFEH